MCNAFRLKQCNHEPTLLNGRFSSLKHISFSINRDTLETKDN